MLNSKVDIFAAISDEEHSLAKVKDILKTDVKCLSLRNSSNETPLQFAIINNKTDIVTLLLEAGADAFDRGLIGKYPVALAAEKKLWACVRVLVESKDKVLKAVKNYFPQQAALGYALTAVVQAGEIELVKILLSIPEIPTNVKIDGK